MGWRGTEGWSTRSLKWPGPGLPPSNDAGRPREKKNPRDALAAMQAVARTPVSACSSFTTRPFRQAHRANRKPPPGVGPAAAGKRRGREIGRNAERLFDGRDLLRGTNRRVFVRARPSGTHDILALAWKTSREACIAIEVMRAGFRRGEHQHQRLGHAALPCKFHPREWQDATWACLRCSTCVRGLPLGRAQLCTSKASRDGERGRRKKKREGREGSKSALTSQATATTLATAGCWSRGGCLEVAPGFEGVGR